MPNKRVRSWSLGRAEAPTLVVSVVSNREWHTHYDFTAFPNILWESNRTKHSYDTPWYVCDCWECNPDIIYKYHTFIFASDLDSAIRKRGNCKAETKKRLP